MMPIGTGGSRLGGRWRGHRARVRGPVDPRARQHQVALDPGPGQQHAAGRGEGQVRHGQVPTGVQAAPDGDAGEVQRVAGRAGQLGTGEIEVPADPAARQPQLARAAQPAGVAGAAHDDPVGHQRPPAPAVQPPGRQPQRPADLGVGEVDRSVGGEAVVEQQVRGDPQVPGLEPRHPAPGEREARELAHPQVGRLEEGAVAQLDRPFDPRAVQHQPTRHGGPEKAQRPGARGERLGQRGRGQLGGAQVGHPQECSPAGCGTGGGCGGTGVSSGADVRASCSSRAANSSSVHDATSGRARSSALRSRSVIPPHTPNSTRWSSAWARHSVRTRHGRQNTRASRWRAPVTNSPSASAVRHRAATRQFRLSAMPALPLVGAPAGIPACARTGATSTDGSCGPAVPANSRQIYATSDVTRC
jgi:hypothetical protein